MKKYLFGIFAVALAVSFSAFKPTTTVTLKFVGSPTSSSDVTNPAKYEVNSVSCSLGTAICSVQMDDSFTKIDPNNSNRRIIDGSKVTINATFTNPNYDPTFSGTGLSYSNSYQP